MNKHSGKNLSASEVKYPASMRIVHWLRAILILGLIASGWYMTGLTDSQMETAGLLYPNHKQFDVLVWLVALLHLYLRWQNKTRLPGPPPGLKNWEKWLSHAIHRVIIALTLLIPLLGYSMSSSYTESDGVPFFFLPHLPELLPKNDRAFVVFQALHKYGAYLLLGCIFLHIAGAAKHRILDKNGETDVVPRML